MTIHPVGSFAIFPTGLRNSRLGAFLLSDGERHMISTDNGGIRSCKERRQQLIPINFLDRRSGMERREAADRRSGQDRRSPKGFRFQAGLDRRSAWNAPAAREQIFS